MKRVVEEEEKALKTLDTHHDEKVKLIELNDGRSFILMYKLAKADRLTEEELDTLWSIKPETKGSIILFGKLTETPRYSQTYSDNGEGYNFSGMTHGSKPLTPLLRRLLDLANMVCHSILETDYGGRRFNMAFVNWYPDGAHSIGYHADDETQLYLNSRGETLVFSLSFGQERTFLLRRKETKEEKRKREEKNQKREKALSLPLETNTALLMAGLTQKNYEHSVPKTEDKNKQEKRLNITFRIFKHGNEVKK